MKISSKKILTLLLISMVLFLGRASCEESQTSETPSTEAAQETENKNSGSDSKNEDLSNLDNLGEGDDSLDFLEDANLKSEGQDSIQGDSTDSKGDSGELDEAELEKILKEEGMSDADISELKKISKEKGKQKDPYSVLGKDSKVARDAVGDANALIEDVNNYSKLKSNMEEAQILSDVASMESGEKISGDEAAKITPEQQKEYEAYEKAMNTPLTEDQKKLLKDLERDLAEIDDEEFESIDL